MRHDNQRIIQMLTDSKMLTVSTVIIFLCLLSSFSSSLTLVSDDDVKSLGMFELFEGNDASQNMVCTLTWTQVCIYELM